MCKIFRKMNCQKWVGVGEKGLREEWEEEGKGRGGEGGFSTSDPNIFKENERNSLQEQS